MSKDLQDVVTLLEARCDAIAESRSFWTNKAHDLEMECQRLVEENERLKKSAHQWSQFKIMFPKIVDEIKIQNKDDDLSQLFD